MAVASVLSKIIRRKRTLKDRTREVKGKTKSKKFEEVKKKADEADKKKADKADKKASSPKMAAEKKAARPARGDAKDLKKDDTPRIKRLEKVKKNIGQDQKGKINRLFADKAEGNFKGKQQMLLAAGPAKGFDKAAKKVSDLYDKIKSGKYTQRQYRDFVDAQAKVKDAMSRRGDSNLAKDNNLTKAMLSIKPKNPADFVGKEPKAKGKILRENVSPRTAINAIAKYRKKLGQAERRRKRLATPEQKASAKRLKEKAELRKSKEKYGFNQGGLKMPSANQTGLKKLPTQVRNKMGYMYGGGMAKKPKMSSMDYRKGGMVMIVLDMMKKKKKGK